MLAEKLSLTHQLSEELSRLAGKASFMPAAEIGKALQYLEEHGIPNNKHEAYKYCNTEAILRKEFKKLDGAELDAGADLRHRCYVHGAYNIYVVNGRLADDQSEIPTRAFLVNIGEAPTHLIQLHIGTRTHADSDAFAALNTAYADRGVFLLLKEGAIIDKPMVIHHLIQSEGTYFYNIRNLFVIENNAQVKITEVYYPAKGKNFCNTLTEVFTGEHAQVKHCQVQNAGNSFYGVDTLAVSQRRYSNYDHAVFTFSGALARNNVRVALAEEFAECHLHGLTFGKGQQIVDHHTRVDHLKPNCESNELYKGIADNRSVITFNGQIFVEKDAQKTNAYQSSKNILLSDDATVNAKPELEIYANDVKCSHGTSTGKVDENALFYLKARGIGEDSARKLLLHAFAHEVIEKVSDTDTRSYIELLFENSLSQA